MWFEKTKFCQIKINDRLHEKYFKNMVHEECAGYDDEDGEFECEFCKNAHS